MKLPQSMSLVRALVGALLCTVGLGPAHAQAVSFIARRDFPTFRAPNNIATGDFNRDGIPDLVVPNSFQESTAINVLIGNRDGSFQPPVFVNTGGQIPSGVGVADFNRDGIPDIAVANFQSGTVSILLGLGDGTFGQPLLASVGAIAPRLLRIGDFNEDGIPDVAVSNQLSNSVSVLLGNGDGTMRLSQIVPVSTS
jgi:VCBS repeat protein/FG-GAP repeat protein